MKQEITIQHQTAEPPEIGKRRADIMRRFGVSRAVADLAIQLGMPDDAIRQAKREAAMHRQRQRNPHPEKYIQTRKGRRS